MIESLISILFVKKYKKKVLNYAIETFICILYNKTNEEKGWHMRLPLNVLLYQLSANSIFESQNLDLSGRYDGIKLFDIDYEPEDNKNYLYLISENMMKTYGTLWMGQQILSTNSFLCVCQADKKTTLADVPSGLAVILLYTEESFPVVFNKMLHVFHGFELWDTQFHLALLEHRPLQELLELTSDYLVHPMVILDRSFSLLGYIKIPGVTDPIMEDILEAGFVRLSTMTRLRQDGLLSTSEKAENPLINYYCLTTKDCYYSMMYRFTASNHTVGYALVFKCTVHPKTNYLDLMNIITKNLSLYFQQERFRNRSSSEFYEPLLAEIMEHPDAEPLQYRSRVEYVPGLGMQGMYQLARVDYDNQSEMPHTFVCWNLRNSIADLKPFISQNKLYVLRNRTPKENETAFLSEEEEVLFKKAFRGIGFQCGISNTFFSIMELSNAARQCDEAIRMGTKYDKDHREFHEFKDYYIYYLLKELKKNTPMSMIESPGYAVLKKYDEENHSDLCDVFMRYLENGRNINQTAAAIFLHRNTVLNKIKKATSIMKNECEDYQAATGYILSYLNDHSL